MLTSPFPFYPDTSRFLQGYDPSSSPKHIQISIGMSPTHLVFLFLNASLTSPTYMSAH